MFIYATVLTSTFGVMGKYVFWDCGGDVPEKHHYTFFFISKTYFKGADLVKREPEIIFSNPFKKLNS